jgi:hypothetical protein
LSSLADEKACRLAPPQHGGARSGASNDDGRWILDVRAAALQEEMAEQRFSVLPGPTKTAAPSEHRRERSEQSTQRDA